MDGQVDVFVAGVGTGGTLSGTGRGLKAHNPAVEIIGVEPDSSAVLSGDKPGLHKIQGIGAGFVPKTYDASVVDKVIRVSDDDAIRTGRELLCRKLADRYFVGSGCLCSPAAGPAAGVCRQEYRCAAS